jgi:hypothetical protein
LAVPGTFRLVPPAARLAELERDYQEMRDMFLEEPATFDTILKTLRGLEKMNQSPLLSIFTFSAHASRAGLSHYHGRTLPASPGGTDESIFR